MNLFFFLILTLIFFHVYNSGNSLNYKIINVKTECYLYVSDDDPYIERSVTCENKLIESVYYEWKVSFLQGNYVIINSHGNRGKSLDLKDGSNREYSVVNVYVTDKNNDNQIWFRKKIGNAYVFKNKKNGKCLHNDDGFLCTVTCDDKLDEQKWKII